MPQVGELVTSLAMVYTTHLLRTSGPCASTYQLLGMIPYQYASRCDKSAQTKEPIIHNPSVTHKWALCLNIPALYL